MIGAVFGLAFLMGPFIAGVVLRYFEWHMLFLVNIPVSLVLIYFSTRILPSCRTGMCQRSTGAVSLRCGVALAGFTIGLNSIDPSKGGPGSLT